MMQTVQLAIADAVYAARVREALSRNCAWHVESVEHPDPSQHAVLVLDEVASQACSFRSTIPSGWCSSPARTPINWRMPGMPVSSRWFPWTSRSILFYSR